MENGKCALARNLTNGMAMGSSEFHVLRTNNDIVINDYLFHLLNRQVVRDFAEQNMTGTSGHRRVPINGMKIWTFQFLLLMFRSRL